MAENFTSLAKDTNKLSKSQRDLKAARENDKLPVQKCQFKGQGISHLKPWRPERTVGRKELSTMNSVSGKIILKNEGKI